MIKIKVNGWFAKSFLQYTYPKSFCSLVWYTLLFSILWSFCGILYLSGIYTLLRYGIAPAPNGPELGQLPIAEGWRALMGASSVLVTMFGLAGLGYYIIGSIAGAISSYIDKRELKRYDESLLDPIEKPAPKEPSIFVSVVKAAYDRFKKKTCVLVEYKC